MVKSHPNILQCLVFYTVLIFLINGTLGKVVKHSFLIEYISGSPDGVYKDKILGVNGQFPGPTIEADIGDTLEIDVINRIQDGQNTSIHWHGIHQKGSWFEDGTSQISQCPLRYGYTQRYRFDLHQAGTFWYHSHVNSQYTEGLWGSLIVHALPEVYSYDAEILLALNDWYHRTAYENEVWHLSAPSRGVPPYPDSGMINGLGRYPCDYANLQGRSCSPLNQSRPVFKVQRDKTYRIRVINTSAVSAFNFSIDGHPLQAIEVDGLDLKAPIPADIASIGAAQRYSFLIHTDNADNPLENRFLIRATLRNDSLMLINGVNINSYPECLMIDVTAILEYDSSPTDNLLLQTTTESHTYLDLVPESTMSSLKFLEEFLLSPKYGGPAPPFFDTELILEAGFYEDELEIRRGSFNQTPFFLPDHKPLLMRLVDNDPIPQEAFPIELGYNKVVQIIINNPFYGPHPFHMHGHHFWVLGSGGWHDGDFDFERDGHRLTLEGAKRDTVMVEEMSWAVIRFWTDNPGLWTFHCHIDWHNLSGMAVTFIVGREEAMKRIRVTEEARRVCGFHYENDDNESEETDEIGRSAGVTYAQTSLYFSLLLLIFRVFLH